jgi:hypothetical protein
MARRMSTVAVRQMPSSIGRVDWSIGRVQHEAAARLDRPSHKHLHRPDAAGQTDEVGLRNDVELDEKVRHAQIGGRLVHDDAHRPFRGMGANIDDGAREALVPHAGHGDEHLAVEVAGSGVLFRAAELSHHYMLRRASRLSIFPPPRLTGSWMVRRPSADLR